MHSMYYYIININTVFLSSFASFSGGLHIEAKLAYVATNA